MFEYKYKIQKSDIKTTYGSVCLNNVVFEPSEIEKYLPEIVFYDDNLKHMFAETVLTTNKKRNIYKRFIPKDAIKNGLDIYVKKAINDNKNFYSFLAEGILGLVFRDLYGYDLTKGVIDVTDTLNDTHSGVDACMYNLKENIIVLGEAKFYESLNLGINQIIDDFTKKNIKNKIASFQSNVECCEEAYQIIIKNLCKNSFDELTISEFVNQKIVFAGFVLHSEKTVNKYSNKNFYDCYNISVELLKRNICKDLSIDEIKGEYEILLVHLPVGNKQSLIVKIIEKSQELLNEIMV